MKAPMLNVTVGDGKYTVVQEPSGRLHALRNGEHWRDCIGDNLVLALAQEVENLQAALRETEEERDKLIDLLWYFNGTAIEEVLSTINPAPVTRNGPRRADAGAKETSCSAKPSP